MPSLWPVGSGDMWNVLMGDKVLKFPSVTDLIAEGFEYLQVLGTSNALEKCFDCFAVGMAEEEKLDWTTKAVQSFEKFNLWKSTNNEELNVESKIFVNKDS
jgi:UDP-N-acetylglucosamine pyrophosphorylase